MTNPSIRVVNNGESPPVPIIRTKLALPRLPAGMVRRPRLHALLDLGMQHPLTLVVAPAGYGKTTALVEWLRLRGHTAAWLSIDEDDNKTGRFFSYLVNALEIILPGLESRVGPLLLNGQADGLEAALSLLVRELASCPEDFILVLDDYQWLQEPEIQRGMTFIFNYMPAGMHIMIATRQEPLLPLPRMRVKNQVVELDGQDLRFQPEEISAFYRQRNLELSDAETGELENRTEGWAAGLQMAYLSLPGDEDLRSWLDGFDAGNHYLKSYLEEEVFSQWSGEMRLFMLQTCILTSLNGSLCNAVTGGSEAERCLEVLASANAFIRPLDHKHNWYCYHPLWAEYLSNRLENCPEIDVQGLHLRAGAWYMENRQWEESVRHFLLGQELEKALALMETAAPYMLENRESALLLNWIERLPAAMVEASTVLCLASSWSHFMNSDEAAGNRWLTRAEESLARQEQQGASGQWVTLMQGEVELCKAFQALNKCDLPAIENHVGAARRLIPNKAIFYKEISAMQSREASLLNTCMGFYGQLDLCLEVISSQSYSIIRDISINIGMLPVAKAEVLYEKNRIDEALFSLRQGMPEAERSGYMMALLPGILTLARIYRSRGDWIGALQLLDEWEEKISASRQLSWLPLLDACRAGLNMEAHNEEAALRWIHERHLSVMDPLSVRREYEYITLARLLIGLGKRNDALLLISGLMMQAEQEKRLPSRIEIGILQAIAHQQHGDADQSMLALRKALLLGEQYGYLRRFADEGAAMNALIRQYTRWQPSAQMEPAASISYEYVKTVKELTAETATVSSSVRIPAASQNYSPGIVFEPLTARELEVLKLLASGSSNAHIASQLGLALATVKFHTKNIFSKLMVSNRVQAVHRARELFMLN